MREGRPQRSKIIKNSANPQFNEEFFLLVDDFDHQRLSIKVGPSVSLMWHKSESKCVGVWTVCEKACC